MKEIGGYIELEHYNNAYLHMDALALNCGRNALAYLVEAKEITKIMIPYFLCESCQQILTKYNVEIGYYQITENFFPCEVKLEKNQWIYIVNYYGQLSNSSLMQLKEKYKRIIVDNVQSYFQMPVDGVAVYM